MAKRTKKSETVKPDEVVDAEVVEVETVETDVPDTVEATSDDTPEITAETPQDDAVEMAEETPATPEEPAPPAAPPAPVYADSSRENGVLLPMIFGGLIAGGIGYGAAYLMQPVVDVPLEQQVAAHNDEIEALQASIGEIPDGPDLSPLSDQIAANFDEVSGMISDVDGRIASLEERLNTLEKQPNADGTLQDTAVAAFQRELDELRNQTEQMSADAAAALQATRDEAAAIEQNAVENARIATAQAALARVQGALESGAPFGDVLTDLADAIETPIPAALSDAADGVPTLGQLQADFPSVARAALASARSEGASGDDNGGIGSFLRNQLNVRSVTPQEGNSADAILSRAEASLREGRLNETIAETATLPEVSRGALSEWLARAEMRSNALTAADDLNQSLTAN